MVSKLADPLIFVLYRLLHHAQTVVIEGQSFRMKDQIEPEPEGYRLIASQETDNRDVCRCFFAPILPIYGLHF